MKEKKEKVHQWEQTQGIDRGEGDGGRKEERERERERGEGESKENHTFILCSHGSEAEPKTPSMTHYLRTYSETNHMTDTPTLMDTHLTVVRSEFLRQVINNCRTMVGMDQTWREGERPLLPIA
jgi:hypothetical protein